MVIATTAIALLGTLFASSIASHRYEASAYVVVSPGGSANIQASEADTLATTYAGLILSDTAILDFVGARVHRSTISVHNSISVLVENTTAVLRLTYTSSDRLTAILGSRSLAQAIAGTNPVSTAIPSDSVDLVSLPTAAAPTGGVGFLDFILGAIGGLLVGLIAAVAWELLDPRVDGLQKLGTALHSPVSDARLVDGPPARALIERWIGGNWALPVIALVPARHNDTDGANEVRRRLLAGSATPSAERITARTNNRRGTEVAMRVPRPISDERLVVYGPPGPDGVGQNAALHAQTVVLVVTSGTRVADVQASVQLLTEFGHPPDWGILLHGDEAAPIKQDGESS